MFSKSKSPNQSQKNIPVKVDIDLTPLLNAARHRNYDVLREMISEEYSLLWQDHRTFQTALKTLAREGHNEAVLLLLRCESKRCDLDPEKYSNSTIFKYLLNEVLEGAALGRNDALIKLIHDTYGTEGSILAKGAMLLAKVEMGEKTFDDLKSLSALRSRILLRLTRSSDINTAVKLVKLDCQRVDWNTESDMRDVCLSEIKTLIEGIAQNQSLPFNETVKKVLTELKISEKLEVSHAIVIGGAAAGGHIKCVLTILESCYKNKDPHHFITNVRQAMLMAAKYGQMTLVSKLCDLLKSADIAPDNYFQILMEATGNAMKENHFALMRKLMDKVPVNVAGAGLPVLGWHREQILHLYRQVRDPLICYQIAMSQHAAVIGVNGKSQDFWLSILKEEYHLNEMSDEGFGIVVNHPEMVYLLARTYYKRFPDGDSAWSTLPVDLIPMIAMMTTNRALSDNDKKILIREIREAGACPDIDKPIQQRNLQRLMTHVTIPKDNHISILWFRVKKKEALSALKKSKNKFLCQHIKDAGSVAKLYAVLKDGLSEASSNDKKIIESCLQEFHEGPDARLPFVVRAVEKYESKRQQKISGKVD